MEGQQILKPSAEALDLPINILEIRAVMDKLPLGKQAGPNRIPMGVYRVLSKFFAPYLCKVFKEARRVQRLPASMLNGDITLLFKKKDREDVRNYRPLTMLNTDYKIYTKILANRLKTVVHQFVAECQKGFVPKTFIAECSMLLHMIEAWVNDDADGRKGIYIFLDMEKAFDRVSFDFLLTSMKALGFGPKFIEAVKMMYDTEAPPQRRIYANGYYSKWFPIRSGVAQGCPLSPLLFLIVGQALKISLDMQPGLKGILIKGKYYKLLQFADDTSLMLGSIAELKHAEKGIKKSCKATGMRENYSKREGLGMGRYRTIERHRLTRDIKWVPEGEWAISLGVPVGNDLDTKRWWDKKLEDIRSHSKRWMALFQHSYFGRNLIVQGMYFGKQRYWLFSLVMPDSCIQKVQAEADILWWSKTPDLSVEQEKRFRRFVAKKTVVGKRSQGGLGNMDWASHVKAFQAQWIIRYAADPAASSWKTLLDSFLLEDDEGNVKFTEGRAIFFCKLNNGHKTTLLSDIPKRAHYIRECIRSFWKLRITQDLNYEHTMTYIAGESPWLNPRFNLGATRAARLYFATTVTTVTLSDLMNSRTNELHTVKEWRYWIRKLDREYLERRVDASFTNRQAHKIFRMTRKIPPHIVQALKKPMQVSHPLDGNIYALIEPDQDDSATVKYGKYIHASQNYEIQWIDAIGSPHPTGRHDPFNGHEAFSVSWWTPYKTLQEEGRRAEDTRLRGPKATTFPATRGWKVDAESVELDDLTIKLITYLFTQRIFKPPTNTQNNWTLRLDGILIPWSLVWGIKSFYATPRDQVTWLKLMHRNIYLAPHKDDPNDTACPFCGQHQNQLHLTKCSKIRQKYWDPIITLMTKMGLPGFTHRSAFLAVGRLSDTQVVGKNHSGILFLAWRCLYAELVRGRVENVTPDLKTAYKRVIMMNISRLQYYGEKWLRWARKNTHTGNNSCIPERHRHKQVLEQYAHGEYEINQIFYDEYARLTAT